MASAVHKNSVSMYQEMTHAVAAVVVVAMFMSGCVCVWDRERAIVSGKFAGVCGVGVYWVGTTLEYLP